MDGQTVGALAFAIFLGLLIFCSIGVNLANWLEDRKKKKDREFYSIDDKYKTRRTQ